MDDVRRKILERIKESLEGIQVPLAMASKAEELEAKSFEDNATSELLSEAAQNVALAIEKLEEVLES